MPFSNRTAAFQSLLLTPGVHRGMVVQPSRRLPTGLSALDALARGGLPIGALTELVGPRSSGKTALGYAVAAHVTARGAFISYIDLADAFDPEQAATAGIRLQRVLWIRPLTMHAALRGAEYVLEAGGFSLIVIDIDHPTVIGGGTSGSAWLRLARIIAASAAAVVTIAPQRIAGTAASLCLETMTGHASFSGSAGHGTLFDGITATLACRKNKFAPSPSSPTPLLAATA